MVFYLVVIGGVIWRWHIVLHMNHHPITDLLQEQFPPAGAR